MVKYRRLAREERYQIEVLLKSGKGIRETARILKRCSSTISREIERNHSLRNMYVASYADLKTQTRRLGIGPVYKIQGTLEKYVIAKLALDWSPEQISGRLRHEKSVDQISTESIYQYVFRNRRLRGRLWTHLRRRRRYRYSRSCRIKAKRGCCLVNRVPISQRPPIVEERKRLGDYERDLIVSRKNFCVILTIVDRVSRLTRMAFIKKRTSLTIHKKTVKLLKGMPVHTITNDNGTEFAMHEETGLELQAKLYFSDPNASWQRGTNENTNGLVRQYFPKRQTFTEDLCKNIGLVERLLNNRPRKILHFKTPYEVHREKSGVALSV